jgi:anti-sigma B factor antagonist
MEWTVVRLDSGVTLVELAGRMDVPGALKADPAFTEIAQENLRVMVDLTKLDFLASLGIRTLVTTSKTLRAKEGNLVLFSPQPNIEQVLHSSGIDTIIPVVKDRALAEVEVLA